MIANQTEELIINNFKHYASDIAWTAKRKLLAKKPSGLTGGNTFDVDKFIESLLKVKGGRMGWKAAISEEDILKLCMISRGIFLKEPVLLQLKPPLLICGDIHGQYMDLLRLFDHGGYPPAVRYLFLGDYVDRGKNSIECISLLLAYKIKYGNKIYLLRGNHECAGLTRIYGFFDECKRHYSVKLWKTFIDCFNCIPIAAVIDEKVFCCHGGLSPELHKIDQICSIPRPIEIPDNGLLCDLLWSDPCPETIGWGPNDRGVSYVFGSDIVKDFLSKTGMDLIVRAHQVVEDGYEFFAARNLVTVFSAPNYCGDFDNKGAMMFINEQLVCSFKIIKPEDPRKFIYTGPKQKKN